MKHMPIRDIDRARELPAHDPASEPHLVMKPIDCELECQRIIERIAALAGCLEDSSEEVELAVLVEQVELWEAKRWLQ